MAIPATDAVATLDTPALLLDGGRLSRNAERLATQLRALAVPQRPPVKTAKSLPTIARALLGQPGGVTVSTLREAEAWLEGGITDILHAVDIAPQKLPRLRALRALGADVAVVLDSIAAAESLRAAGAADASIAALI